MRRDRFSELGQHVGMALRALSARSALRASLSARAEALSLGPGWNAAALYGDSDGGKGLVRLDDVEVVDREPGLLEGQRGGWDHTRPHNRRVDPGHGGGDQPACPGHTEFLCLTLAAHEHHGSSVVDARGVCGSYRTVFLLEDRL